MSIYIFTRPNTHQTPDTKTISITSLSVYLPDELKARTDSLEREIYELHKAWSGTSDTEAKYQYVTKVRSLPTFGAHFFLVREPEGGRKMVPLLLGIRYDSILRVNCETKETIASFPLSNVKRWAVSGQVFSVDFGGTHKNLSVETWDGKKISDLLDQYVKSLLEESKKVTVINSLAPEPVTIMKRPMTEAQKVLLKTIDNGKKKIKKSREHLLKKNREGKARYKSNVVLV